jgi:hypothetical protein
MKLFFLILIFPVLLHAQHQERQILFYNLGFGGITSGIGAVINKKDTENWKKAFLKGFWQGSIGGMFNYSSKKTIGLISRNKNFAYALPARLLSSAGNSIIQNAAANEPFLQNWNFEFGILRFDYFGKAEHKFRVRVLPVAVIASAAAISKGKFDVRTTLLTGVMSFISKDSIRTERGKYDGVNYGRAFVYYDSLQKYHVVSHEITHDYQYREYLVFNSLLRPTVSKIKNQRVKKFFTKYVYPDIPYFGLAYMLEGMGSGAKFFSNYFEFEAERIASGKYVYFE